MSLSNRVKRIRLSQDKYALVDSEDFDFLSQWKWYFSHGYAVRKDRTGKYYMHQVINATPNGLVTDHTNQDKLDNRKSNLRSATKAQNQRNHATFATNTSGYTGVSWSKIMNKWEAYIWQFNKKINLGYFLDIKVAYNARLEGEKLYWGL